MKKKIFKLLIGFIIAFMLIVPLQTMASMGSVLTTKPPADVIPFTVFDPKYEYLEDGYGSLSNLGNGKINMWAHSFGTINVDTIGVQLTLQRWTGSSWIDVNARPDVIVQNDSYAYYSGTLNVSTGYYYRVKTVHWIEIGSVREDGIRYSDSLLISD